MKSFRRLASLITNTPPATPPTRKPALVVERLETRDVPATFTVSTLADSGGGSLRQAVADANAAVGVDDVVFAPALAGQVVLTTGEIGITDGVNILGTGAGRVSVSGNNNSRIFYIDTAVARDDVLISGLTLTGGRARDVSAALGDGLDGGALYNVNADLTLQNCVITGNVSDDGAGGGVVHSGYGRLLVQSTVFTNNNSYGSGAGLYAGRGATSITIEDCTFSGNTAGIHGGAVYIRGAAASEIRRSTFDTNTADRAGGALYFGGDNSGVRLAIDRSTFSNNTAGSDGGALYLRTGQVTITNSTFSGNKTDSDGGAISMNEFAFNPSGSSLTIQNSTITGNIAGNDGTGDGGGLYLGQRSQTEVPDLVRNVTVTVENTIIANNLQNLNVANDVVRAANAGNDTTTLNVRFTLIETTPTTGVAGTVNGTNAGNIFGVDPQLGPLANNGGPTQTHALLPGSPAINTGDPAFAAPPSTDQRGQGFARVNGGRVDIGAFEVQPPVVTPPGPQPPTTPTVPLRAGGTGFGGQGAVAVFGPDLVARLGFFAFPGYTGPVHVATGDINRDGVNDIFVSTAVGADHVKVFDGANGALLRSFLAFGGFTGGLSVGAADVNGDGVADIVVGTLSRADHVKVFDGTTNGTEIRSFLAFGGFDGGVTVAGAGADVVVGTASRSTHVKLFTGGNGAALARSFFAFQGGTTGVSVGASDLNGDGVFDIVAGTATVSSHVKAFAGGSNAELFSRFAFPGHIGGISVAGDGSSVLVGATGVAPAHVKRFSAAGLETGSVIFFPGFNGGIEVG